MQPHCHADEGDGLRPQPDDFFRSTQARAQRAIHTYGVLKSGQPFDPPYLEKRLQPLDTQDGLYKLTIEAH